MAGRPKPWETAAPTSSDTGLAARGAGLAKPWEAPAAPQPSVASQPQPARPWERNGSAGAGPSVASDAVTQRGAQTGSLPDQSAPIAAAGPYSTAGGVSGLYGSSYGLGGGYGGAYNSSYGGMYGGYNRMGYGSYGGGYGGLGGYGGYGGYGSGYGSGYGGYGMGTGMGMGMGMGLGGMGPGMGPMDPNDPMAPAQPPPAWQHALRALHGVVSFFGRISFLVDENTQAIHFFITALLQLLDRCGSLYSELARFVLRLLGFRTPARKAPPAPQAQQQQHAAPGASVAPR
ncbi:unnamed protein product [Pedinophyceae sp. YPF-701]|nr:unnamed protein product [Pedinophyceae sp. YPF-701]